MSTSSLADWQSLAAYQADRRATFPSMESLRWQVRLHRAALVEAGAITALAGRTHLHSRLADAVFVEVGRRRLAEAA